MGFKLGARNSIQSALNAIAQRNHIGPIMSNSIDSNSETGMDNWYHPRDYSITLSNRNVDGNFTFVDNTQSAGVIK